MDGGFAEYIKTPGVNLCRAPDNVPLEHACILGDAVATSYHAVVKRAQVRPGQTVACIGVGGVGLHALQLAKLAGARVIAVDINAERLETARELGADEIIHTGGAPFDAAIRDLTAGSGVDVLLEFVSNEQTLPSSLASVKRGGKLVFVGYVPEIPMSLLPHYAVRNELEILGSRANTKQDLQDTMNLVAAGKVRPIVDRVFPLSDLELAFDALRQGAPVGRNVVAV